MTNRIATLALALALPIGLAACGGDETTIEAPEVETTMDDMGTEIDGAMDDAGESVDGAMDDAGAAMDDAGEAVDAAVDSTL